MRTTCTGIFLPGVLVALVACTADDAPPSLDCPTNGRYLELVPVDVVEEEVVVPAGAFCALRVSRTSVTPGGGGSDKTFWFARGVGKVKPIGLGQTAELISVSGL